MKPYAKRSWTILIGLILPALFAAQALAVAGRNVYPSARARVAPRPMLPAYPTVVLPDDDPRLPRTAPSPRPPARPVVARNPDPLHRMGALIEISIKNQEITAWRDGVVVMRFPISTGRPGYATPRGHYKVIYKNRKAWSSDWGVYMPWAMNWHGNYFIHQLPHYPGSTKLIGADELGRPASHGCVRVGVGNAEKLYRWTKMYTPVWVH